VKHCSAPKLYTKKGLVDNNTEMRKVRSTHAIVVLML